MLTEMPTSFTAKTTSREDDDDALDDSEDEESSDGPKWMRRGDWILLVRSRVRGKHQDGGALPIFLPSRDKERGE